MFSFSFLIVGMEDTVTELHLAVQQLSIAMFTGLGVTQRDATTADTRPLVSSPASGGGGGGEDGSVATE